MLLKRTTSVFQAPAKFASGRLISLEVKLISLEVKLVDTCVPDWLLLFYLNALDKRIPPKAIDRIISGLGKLPQKVRCSLIIAADKYVPDAVASSRKICAVLAGVGKYIPDSVIPSEAAEGWSNLKTKFHIPTLVSR